MPVKALRFSEGGPGEDEDDLLLDDGGAEMENLPPLPVNPVAKPELVVPSLLGGGSSSLVAAATSLAASSSAAAVPPVDPVLVYLRVRPLVDGEVGPSTLTLVDDATIRCDAPAVSVWEGVVATAAG
jgi:hypothetical protein